MLTARSNNTNEMIAQANSFAAEDDVVSFASATPDSRPRRKSMARRSGQVGYEEVKRRWYHVRFRIDVPGQEKRAYLSRPICPISGPGSRTKPERLKLGKQIIAASGADTEEHFNKVE